MDDFELTESMQKLLIVMQRLDQKIAPLLEADGEFFNKRYSIRSLELCIGSIISKVGTNIPNICIDFSSCIRPSFFC
jgi:hypothetical protein